MGFRDDNLEVLIRAWPEEPDVPGEAWAELRWHRGERRASARATLEDFRAWMQGGDPPRPWSWLTVAAGLSTAALTSLRERLGGV